MQTTFLKPLLRPADDAGSTPLVTVCADVTHVTESADTELELRVRAVTERLRELGAPQPARAAVADRLLEGNTDPRAGMLRGRALVTAADGTVLLDEALTDAPLHEVVEFSALPELLPLLRQLPGRVPHVVVITDRVGADVEVVGADGEPEVVESVDGETQYLRKVHVGGWSHLRYQHTAEDVWRRNADQVAAEVVRRAQQVGARFVLVAGEERARAVLLERLPDLITHLVVTTDAGGRSSGADRAAIAVRQQALVAEQLAYQDAATAERIVEGLHHGDSVLGLDAVVDALQQARVDTLVLAQEGVGGLLRTGSGPLEVAQRAEDLAAMGVRDSALQDADQALLWAAIGSDAEVVLLPQSLLPNRVPVAALLRYVETPTEDLR